MSDIVYTIGHSTNSIERFVERLEQHEITVVCDVRSTPYSRMNPQFNREALRFALVAMGIRYVFLGRELGARSEERSCYRNGQVQYDLLAQTDLFKQGIERVKFGAARHRIALMCAEKEPLDCHRTVLVSRHLEQVDLAIKHILGDGRIEDHGDTVRRLISTMKINGVDMFRTEASVIEDAYRKRGDQIAYREQVPETLTDNEATPAHLSRFAE